MDNRLKRELYEYLEMLQARDHHKRKYDPAIFDLQVASAITTPSPEIRDYLKSMHSKGFTEDEIIKTIQDMWAPLNQEIAEHLRKLFKEREVSTSSFGERSFLSDGYVRLVLSGKRSLSKETLFGICLYLELSKEEVDEFLKIYGYNLTDSIEDRMFKLYVDNKIYAVRDYVDDCLNLAKAAGVKLPGFFYKEYTNDTYRVEYI